MAARLPWNFSINPTLRWRPKKNGTPVTIADRSVEDFLRAEIEREFPGEEIVGEERGVSGTNDIRWIVDPIDGTASLVEGIPEFGTLIGLEVHGKVQVGVLYLPALGDLLSATPGKGAWWYKKGIAEPERAQVSQKQSIDSALFCATQIEFYRRKGMEPLRERMVNACERSENWGDCYAHFMVATGRAEIALDPAMEIWDCAALEPIILEAGGTFTTIDGKETIDGGSALSTNGILHQSTLDLIKNLQNQ